MVSSQIVGTWYVHLKDEVNSAKIVQVKRFVVYAERDQEEWLIRRSEELTSSLGRRITPNHVIRAALYIQMERELSLLPREPRPRRPPRWRQVLRSPFQQLPLGPDGP